MTRTLPPLLATRAFESAARNLSFQVAADELHVTPSAISHQIRSLDAFAKVVDPPTDMFLERAICHAYLGQEEAARANLHKYLERAPEELSSFPGDDPAAWRAFFLHYHSRRRREVTDHFIEGARKAGLNVA